MGENERINVLECWAESSSLHDHYLVFEIGEKQSRLSIMEGKTELYSRSLDTSNYLNLGKKKYLFPMIRNSLLTNLILEEEAA